jgi:hypothetical protein
VTSRTPELVLLVGAAADQHRPPDRRRQPVEQAQHVAAQQVGGEVLDLDRRPVPAGPSSASGRWPRRWRPGPGWRPPLAAEDGLGGGEGLAGGGLVEGPEGGHQAGQQPRRVVVLHGRGRAEQAGRLRHRHALDPAPVEEPDHGHVLVGVEPLAEPARDGRGRP